LLLLSRILAAGVFRNARWLLALWLVGVGILTSLVWWNEQARSVVFLGVLQEDYLPGQPREVVLLSLLQEFFSWAWALACFVYLLPAVLLPLARSYSISQVLWLRLTPCTARDLAAARLGHVVLATLFLGALTLSWAVVCAWYHAVAVTPFLVLALGVVAHLWLAGGLVVLTAPLARSETGRALYACAALLLPLLSCAMMEAGRHSFGAFWRRWWPYAGPFVASLEPPLRHFTCCAGLGLLLLLISVLVSRGRLQSGVPCR
jgi:hypothetical protein